MGLSCNLDKIGILRLKNSTINSSMGWDEELTPKSNSYDHIIGVPSHFVIPIDQGMECKTRKAYK